MISDDDPLWEQHSGLDGHQGTEWAAGDDGLARQVYEAASPKARRILDLLIDHPGERLSADDVAADLGDGLAGTSVSARRHGVAASLGAVRSDHLASHRRLPFYWWRGDDGAASLYAMKASVAEVFRNARNSAADHAHETRQPSHSALAWTREEEILALALFVGEGSLNGGPVLSEDDARVIALSGLLRALPTHPGVARDDKFRNPSSVALKLVNFRAAEKAVRTDYGDPEAAALPAGMPRISALDRAIFEEYFARQFSGLAEDADAIRSAVRAAKGPIGAGITVEDRPVEDASTVTYETAGAEGGTRSRSEHELVQRYADWLSASGVKAVSRLYRMAGLARPFRCDVFVPQMNALIEAKSSDGREAIRMAVGQLLDYQYLESADRALAVLLPYAPAPEIRKMLDALGIGVIWPVGEGFRDSRAGAFTRP